MLPFRRRTLDIYIAKTFIVAYAVCAVSFIGLYVTIEAFAKLDRFLKQEGALPVILWRYYLAMIPTIYTNYMGPVLTSAAGLFTVTLFNRYNELDAAKAHGMSVYRFLGVIFILAGLLTGFTFYLQEKVLPAHRGPIRTALAFSKGKPLEPDPFFDAEHGLSIRVRRYETTSQVATGVEIWERYPDLDPKKHVYAKQMEWMPAAPGDEQNGVWQLHQVSVQRWDELGTLVINDDETGIDKLCSSFPKQMLETTLRPIDLESSDLDISYLSWTELKRQFQRQPYHKHLAVKLHHHFALPLAHILLLLLALPVVLKLGNRSILVGVAISVLICGTFFLLSSICMSIAQDSSFLSPVLAAWLPVMLFGALGITLFDQLRT